MPEAKKKTSVKKAASPRRRVAGGTTRRGAARTITIEQHMSGIGCIEGHKRVLKSLGLRHPHHRVVRPDNPAVRGMVKTIPHLVRIVENEHAVKQD